MTAIAAAGVAIALGTTGCGAGQISQTANQLPAVNGGSATATWDNVEVRDVQIIYPADKAADVFNNGGPFDVSFTVVNSSATKTYKLTKIAVTQQGAPASAAVTIGRQPVLAPGTAVRTANIPAGASGTSETTSAGSAQNGSTQNGSTQNGSTQNGSTQSSTAEASAGETTAESSASPTTTTGATTPGAPVVDESVITASVSGAGKSVAAGLTTELTFYFQVQDDNGTWADAGTIKTDAAVAAGMLDRPVGGGQEAEGQGGH
ncbi:hypothetical protein ACPXB3_13060 [Gordonia sp. DT219]|uniref:hypothetical protein n=1 Tax=Gordonia sp. DT219 TaxID=3416658 RepID=UPI003CF5B6D2